MNKRWSDFLFAIATRVVGGSILGGLAGLLVGWKLILRRAARDDTQTLVLWFSAWAIGGALVAAFRIPYWQRPWYNRTGDSEGDRGAASENNFRRVAPELYNRAAYPSLKQFHDFARWLKETTVAELECARGDIEATKAVLLQFFQRGFKAGLFVAELTEMIPTILDGATYSDDERAEVVAILNATDFDDLKASFGQTGLDSQPPIKNQT